MRLPVPRLPRPEHPGAFALVWLLAIGTVAIVMGGARGLAGPEAAASEAAYHVFYTVNETGRPWSSTALSYSGFGGFVLASAQSLIVIAAAIFATIVVPVLRWRKLPLVLLNIWAWTWAGSAIKLALLADAPIFWTIGAVWGAAPVAMAYATWKYWPRWDHRLPRKIRAKLTRFDADDGAGAEPVSFRPQPAPQPA